MSWSADNRLAERIRERVAQIVLFELGDPRIAFTTITRCQVAKDLSHCKVFYSVLGSDADRSKTRHALVEASGFVQREVGKVLRTRTVPHLTFVYDDAVEGNLKMQKLLDELGRERGVAPAEGAPAPPPGEGEASDEDSESNEGPRP